MDKQKYIEEETFVILHSGEIPEVTLHESLYHLTADPDGPGLMLEEVDIRPLKDAVVQRYTAIILRDLDPGNRDKSIYRGLARCLANWQRLLNFCSHENFDIAAIQAEAAKALQKFLDQEIYDVSSGKRTAAINCSMQDVKRLISLLGISKDDLPQGWQSLCPKE